MANADLIEDLETLYERDFALWIERQAALLREGRLDRLDVPNLLEEIEDMGRSEKRAIKSNLVVLLLHLLKHQYQPRRRGRSWRASIVEHRQRLRDDLRASPSLLRYARSCLPEAYADARERASAETGLAPDTFPSTCPFTFDQALDPHVIPD